MTSKPSTLWNRALLSASLVLLTAAGCHKNNTPPPPAAETAPEVTAVAPTASLTADPLAIDLGQSVVLNWRTTKATSVSIDGIGEVPVNGTQTVSPSSSTNFHLIAKGDGGTSRSQRSRHGSRPRNSQQRSADAERPGGDMGSDAEPSTQNVADVFFDYDSYDAAPRRRTAAITAAAAYLNAHPAIKVLIGGYCDDRGSAEYNITLGENRANAAKTALISAGVVSGLASASSATARSASSAPKRSEACWQQNRRDAVHHRSLIAPRLRAFYPASYHG
jgi:peptidoglycan-associated lipoprotein